MTREEELERQLELCMRQNRLYADALKQDQKLRRQFNETTETLKREASHLREENTQLKKQAGGEPCSILPGDEMLLRAYKTLALEAPLSMIILDATGRLLFLNANASELSGWQAHEVEGRFFWDLGMLESSDLEAARTLFEALKTAAYETTFTAGWRTRSGESRKTAWRVVSIADDAGTVHYVSATGTPVLQEQEEAFFLPEINMGF